jgi:hypothetical protein
LDRRGMRVPRIKHRVQHFGREIELRKGDAHVDYWLTHFSEYTQTVGRYEKLGIGQQS